MKASKLIAILAEHMSEHGDHEVLISPEDLVKPYRTITNCWYNYGKDWGVEGRFLVGGQPEGGNDEC